MSTNSKQSTSESKRSSNSPVSHRTNKILRLEDLSFENEVYNALLSSEESDNEDIDAFLVSEAECEQKHESDQEEGEETLEIEENNTRSTSPENESSDDDVPISELRLRPKYYYGKNRYKWANNPPSSRVRTPRHNIVTNNSFLIRLRTKEMIQSVFGINFLTKTCVILF